MGNPQQPEARRSGKGAATPQESGHLKAAQPQTPKKSRGDKEERSRRGDPTPPEQRPEHP